MNDSPLAWNRYGLVPTIPHLLHLHLKLLRLTLLSHTKAGEEDKKSPGLESGDLPFHVRSMMGQEI